MQILRPMLAAKAKSLEDFSYPAIATPKIDGIRACVVGGQLLTRAFKLVPNRHIQESLASLPDGVDGELVAEDFYSTQSAVMSRDGRPDFKFVAFDFAGHEPYCVRLLRLLTLGNPYVEAVDTKLVESEADLLRYEEHCLAQGYEGLVVRDPSGPYKFGRSTRSEGYMLKLKRVDDAEAVLVGVVEARANLNPVVPNVWGYAKRPGGSSGKVPKATLGALQCRLADGTAFEIGTGKGLTAELRQKVWDNPSDYIGKLVRFTHQGFGTLGRPRFPSFYAFRDPEDV